jgi:hypothetical protein
VRVSKRPRRRCSPFETNSFARSMDEPPSQWYRRLTCCLGPPKGHVSKDAASHRSDHAPPRLRGDAFPRVRQLPVISRPLFRKSEGFGGRGRLPGCFSPVLSASAPGSRSIAGCRAGWTPGDYRFYIRRSLPTLLLTLRGDSDDRHRHCERRAYPSRSV